MPSILQRRPYALFHLLMAVLLFVPAPLAALGVLLADTSCSMKCCKAKAAKGSCCRRAKAAEPAGQSLRDITSCSSKCCQAVGVLSVSPFVAPPARFLTAGNSPEATPAPLSVNPGFPQLSLPSQLFQRPPPQV